MRRTGWMGRLVGGMGVGGVGMPDSLPALVPHPLSPAAVCFAMVFVPKAGERGVRAQRFSDEQPLWFSSAHPPTLWLNWCGPRGSAPDPQGQSGDPEGPAVKTWSLLTSKDTGCAYRTTRPGDPFC